MRVIFWDNTNVIDKYSLSCMRMVPLNRPGQLIFPPLVSVFTGVPAQPSHQSSLAFKKNFIMCRIPE